MTESCRRTFRCQFCRKRFSTSLRVKKHLVKDHLCAKNRETDKTTITQNTQNSLNTLNTPSSQNSNWKPFTCTKCLKGFRLRHGLNVHLRLKRCYDQNNKTYTTGGQHGGQVVVGSRVLCNFASEDRPFTCGKCKQPFKLRHQLNVHLKKNRCTSSLAKVVKKGN